MPPTALLYDPDRNTWLQFDAPLQVYTTNTLSEVRGLLATIEQQVEERGLHAVGMVSYEAAAAFEPTAQTLPAGDFPLLWFGLFASPRQVPAPKADTEPPPLDWTAQRDAAEFAAAVERIKTAIAGGETYQVNFTFGLSTPFTADPWPLFCRLVQNQPHSYAAWIDTGRYVIASASPELFFDRVGSRLVSRPMKGTARRGLTLDDDRQQAAALQGSSKERAENVMVLDMIRNDLGRLPGGPVTVEAVCAVEKYPTVWQLTSTAATVTDASLAEIFAPLFPCASITGAPKLRTMHHIAALETAPRQIYTGAIGRLEPGRRARFSVAIRTALIDRAAQTATYGIGAGITWDSVAADEYNECLAKAEILQQTRPPFALLESLLWEPAGGIFLLDAHLDRLEHSALYFDYPFDRDAVLNALQTLTGGLPAAPHKLRLLLSADGKLSTEAAVITVTAPAPLLQVRLARQPVASSDPFLYHKTTHRKAYDDARQGLPDCDEVLLYNERGELTEACNCNLVVKVDGRLVTPPVLSGLLAGTLRRELLKNGEIVEQVITPEVLKSCEELWLINSVRRWRRAELIDA